MTYQYNRNRTKIKLWKRRRILIGDLLRKIVPCKLKRLLLLKKFRRVSYLIPNNRNKKYRRSLLLRKCQSLWRKRLMKNLLRSNRNSKIRTLKVVLVNKNRKKFMNNSRINKKMSHKSCRLQTAKEVNHKIQENLKMIKSKIQDKLKI